MVTNRANEESTTHTEDPEFETSYPVILAQMSLAGILFFMSVGWMLLTTNAILDSHRTFTEFFWALPAIFAVAALLLLTNMLFE